MFIVINRVLNSVSAQLSRVIRQNRSKNRRHHRRSRSPSSDEENQSSIRPKRSTQRRRRKTRKSKSLNRQSSTRFGGHIDEAFSDSGTGSTPDYRMLEQYEDVAASDNEKVF